MFSNRMGRKLNNGATQLLIVTCRIEGSLEAKTVNICELCDKK